MYKIYGTKACPFCTKAVALCEKRAFDYEFILVDGDITEYVTLAHEFHHFSLPLIMKDDEFVGGYDDLHKSTGHHSVLESAMWWVVTARYAITDKIKFIKRMNERNGCHAATAARKEAK